MFAVEHKRNRANDFITLLQQEYAHLLFFVLEALFNPLRITVQCMTSKLTMAFRPTLYNPVQVSIKPDFPNVIGLRRRMGLWANYHAFILRSALGGFQ
jgi:hypothetical protein